MIKKHLIIILIILLNLSAFAQNSTNNKKDLKEYKKYVNKGNIYYNNNDLKNAAIEYKNAIAITDTSYKLNYRLGLIYFNENNTSGAIEMLKRAYKIQNSDSGTIVYYLANSYQNNYQFDSAIFFYQKNLKYSDSSETETITKKILECKNGIELLKDTSDLIIKNIGEKVNSEYADYGFYFIPNSTLGIFTSKRPQNIGGYINQTDNDYFEDLYFTEIEENEIKITYNAGRPLNTEDPDACIGVSKDGKTIFIYSDINNGDIYISNLKNGKWTKPTSFKAVNTIYKETNITVSNDGQYIYFVSDRPGNIGQKDIFYAKKISDTLYSTPVNLGQNINTQYDEDCLYITPTNDTLYFSSQGHNSMGGYDIFFSVKDKNGQWQKAQNIGYPINSPFDDMFFNPFQNGYLFSSIRENNFGKNDIYLVNYIPELNYILTFDFNILEKGNTKTISGSIKIINSDNSEVITDSVFNDSNFEIILSPDNNYNVLISAENCIEYKSTISAQKIKKDTVVVTNIYLTQSPDVFISAFKIYYETNQTKIEDKFYQGLDTLIMIMKEYPTYKLEIAGHTDDIGTEKFNEKLAEKRALAVFEYLTENGIREDRFTYTGYGFSKNIVPNDTEENKRLNRRVEFYILKK